MVALLAAAGVASSMAQLPLFQATDLGTTEGGEQLEQASPTPLPSLAPREAGRGFEVPIWLVFGLFGLIAAVAVVVAVLAIASNVRFGSRFSRRSLRRAERPVTQAAAVGDEVVAALDAGLSELDEADSDPRRAVIACWVRLERAAAAAGTPRLPGDTATDLVLRLLEGHQLSGTVLTGFADVYRLARYAVRHEVDESMREQARAALWRLRGELTEVSA